MDSFWRRVAVAGPDDCWPWTGAKTRGGYGSCKFGGKAVSTHRIAYTLTHGGIEAGLDILHSCDNPPCCNPMHLRAGTHAENMAEAKAKGRSAFGSRNANARLTAEQIDSIREDRRNHVAVARDYGVTAQYIGQLRKRLWRVQVEETVNG